MHPEVVTFQSAGQQCRGWLYRPTTPGPHPLIVMAHGYSGTHAFHYWRAAEGYAEAGIAVLDFDPRHLGASAGTPRQVVKIDRQVADLRAAVAFARGLDGVDPRRIAIYGSSLGGGLAIAAAADDPLIAALVLIVPFVDGLTNLPHTPVRARMRLMRTCVLDRLGRLRDAEPRTIPVFGPPGSPDAIIDRDGCWQAMLEEVEPGGEWIDHGTHYVTSDGSYLNAVTAWEALEQLRFRPRRRLAQVRAPVFMLIGSKDTVTPAGPQRRAGAAVNAEIVERPFNHFDPFRKSVGFDEAMARQLDFARRALRCAQEGAVETT